MIKQWSKDQISGWTFLFQFWISINRDRGVLWPNTHFHIYDSILSSLEKMLSFLILLHFYNSVIIKSSMNIWNPYAVLVLCSTFFQPQLKFYFYFCSSFAQSILHTLFKYYHFQRYKGYIQSQRETNVYAGSPFSIFSNCRVSQLSFCLFIPYNSFTYTWGHTCSQ